MATHNKGLLGFVLLIVISFAMGKTILSAVFFGVLLLLGFILLINNVPPLKWILSRTSRIFDVALFVLATLALVKYGFNIAGALTVAGIGYTLYYGPKLRHEHQERKAKKKSHGNYRSKFNFK